MNAQTFILEPFHKNKVTRDFTIKGSLRRFLNSLHIHYELVGNLSEILIQKQSEAPNRRKNLWENTCFEFFIAPKGLPQYWEFNLSPSGNWNVYHFQHYRAGMREEVTFESLPFNIQHQSESLQLNVTCDMGKIMHSSQPIEIAISSVIKHKHDELSYWALTHCDSKANFHMRDSFILEV